MEQSNETPRPNQHVFLTREEVAKKLNCSLRKVDSMREKDGLPCIKIGGLVRIDEEQLFKWLASKTV